MYLTEFLIDQGYFLMRNDQIELDQISPAAFSGAGCLGARVVPTGPCGHRAKRNAPGQQLVHRRRDL